MTTSERLREGLSRFSWTQVRAISKELGIPVHTIWNIRVGKTKSPRLVTAEPLLDYIKRNRTA